MFLKYGQGLVTQVVWIQILLRNQAIRYLSRKGNCEQSQFYSEFFCFVLKATSEQKQFYSEFSFSFLQANPQQSQFDSEFLLKESMDKINSIQIFSSKRNF